MNIIKEPFRFLVKFRFPILAFMIYILIVNTVLHEGCPFEIILGVPCPSCGITRATVEAIKFNFPKAFYFHPLFFTIPLVLIVLIYNEYKYIHKLYKSNIFWGVLAIAFIIVYILRMIYQFPNEILKINDKSLLQIIIRFIKSLFN